jgi:hypothetical protein
MKYILILLFVNILNSQSIENTKFEEKLFKLIIEEKKINEEFHFERNGSNVEILKITYLGKIKSKSNLNMIFITRYSGKTKENLRANSKLLVFENYKCLGEYYLGGVYYKKPKLEKNGITFWNNSSECNLSTNIDFGKEIPKSIFIKCNETNGNVLGDLFNFERY